MKIVSRFGRAVLLYATGIVLINGGELLHAATNDTEMLFGDGPIRRFQLQIPDSELSKLTRNNREYVHATLVLDGKPFGDIGARLKGQWSFRPVDQKPSFALKFSAFVPGQNLLGFSKILLNNSIQDPTYLSEYITTGLFRDGGVPAARVTHARVSLNGRELGFYVLIEAMNKPFLHQNFKNPKGNLYEGSAKDIDQVLEHDAGPESDQSDVRALAAAARLPLSERPDALGKLLDVEEIYRFLGMTMLVAQHDSYVFNKNNYRLYHNPDSNRFVLIPHGIDGSFTENNMSIRPPAKYLLAGAVLESPQGREAYRLRVGSLFTNAFKLSVVTNRIAVAAERMLAAAPPSEQTALTKQTQDYLQRVIRRHDRIMAQLSEPEPPSLTVTQGQNAALKGWTPFVDEGEATLDKTTLEGHPSLHVKTGALNATGAWRTRVRLEPGSYHFTGTSQTAGAASSSPLTGVNIRVFKLYTRPQRSLSNGVWKELEHRFIVERGGEEVEFIAEYRGTAGEAWFDADSLRVTRE